MISNISDLLILLQARYLNDSYQFIISNSFQFIVSNIFQFIVGNEHFGDVNEEAVIMFEEAGVGAEEVVSSNDYDLCFVDTGEVDLNHLIKMEKRIRLL